MAGLVCFYDVENYFYLRISLDEKLGKHLGIVTCDNNSYDELTEYEVQLGNQSGRSTPAIAGSATAGCFLRANLDNGSLQFSYSLDEKDWKKIGPSLDATRLSDEYCKQGCFTGTFVGICCQDISGMRKRADFDFFEYKEL